MLQVRLRYPLTSFQPQCMIKRRKEQVRSFFFLNFLRLKVWGGIRRAHEGVKRTSGRGLRGVLPAALSLKIIASYFTFTLQENTHEKMEGSKYGVVVAVSQKAQIRRAHV